MQLVFRKSIDIHILTVFSIFGIWLLIFFLSPYIANYQEINDLSGSVFVIDNSEELSDINLFSRVIYTIGDINDHQILERSFLLNGNQLPFCARDTGIFIGLVIGSMLSIFVILRIRPLFLVLGILPLAVDGFFQELTTYESNNTMRIITGLLTGFFFSAFLCGRIALPDERDAEKIGSEAIREESRD